jgi:hypothetical protein
VTFHPGPGKDALRIIGPDGRPFTAVLDVFIERDAQRERADAEHKRAERLAARLRELGIEED